VQQGDAFALRLAKTFVARLPHADGRERPGEGCASKGQTRPPDPETAVSLAEPAAARGYRRTSLARGRIVELQSRASEAARCISLTQRRASETGSRTSEPETGISLDSEVHSLNLHRARVAQKDASLWLGDAPSDRARSSPSHPDASPRRARPRERTRSPPLSSLRTPFWLTRAFLGGGRVSFKLKDAPARSPDTLSRKK
jgi:hypothetical protein